MSNDDDAGDIYPGHSDLLSKLLLRLCIALGHTACLRGHS